MDYHAKNCVEKCDDHLSLVLFPQFKYKYMTFSYLVHQYYFNVVRYCTLCHSLADLARVPDPKVVLASVADLTCGFSRELFIKWAEEPKNTVVFTCRPSPGTLARSLIENLQQKTVDIEVVYRMWWYYAL